jgi:PKD repeat protein
LWIGEVGFNTWEEINRIVDPADSVVENFGWPCFEGTWRQPFYTGLDLCDSLMASETVPPFFNYFHDVPIVGEDCPDSGASVSGISFVPTTNQYPAAYQGALFFSDYSRSCMWVMQRSATSGALPDPANVKVFREDASGPVDLQAGPGGYLYYVDLFDGTVGRIDYSSTKPVASFTATPSSGAAPLPVAFDASASNDPDGTTLTYAWKFGDGTTGTGKTPAHTYQQPGRYTVELTVTDVSGATGTTTRSVSAGVPVATIATPSAATTWSVGQELSFSGSAVDNTGAAIPAANLTWTIVLEHGLCPACHEHAFTSKVGAGGMFDAPNHDLPSSILLRLTATDGDGLVGTATRRLQPRTTELTITSSPSGVSLNLDGETAAGPFTRTVIAGSPHSLEAPAVAAGRTFSSWSDAGARAHSISAPATPATYTANYVNKPPTASFTVSDLTPDKGQPVTFDAAASSDPEGTALTYAWDLDDDGSFDDGTNATASRTYADPGPVTVRLEVRDAHDATATAQHVVSVDNDPPTASISASTRTPFSSTPVTFTADADDPDGSIASYAWDLDDDGAFDDGTAATATASFPTRGPATVRLRVVDNEAAEAEASLAITVLNQLPAISVAAFPADPFVDSPVTLRATATDRDGAIAGVAWDLDGGDAFDDGTGATITRAFAFPGVQAVRAQATDDAGAVAIATAAIEVRDRVPDRLEPAPKVKVAATPTRKGAKVRRFSVKAPRGATIRVRCKGEECPRSKQAKGAGAAKRLHRFERSYRGGTKLVVRVTEPDRIGDYVKVKIRAGLRDPVRTDSCLWPGESGPRACPAG